MPLIRASLGAQLVKNPIAKARDVGLIPGPGRSTCRGAATLVQKPLGPAAQAPQQEKPLRWETHAPLPASAPLSTPGEGMRATPGEGMRAAAKTQHRPKRFKLFFKRI